MEGLNLNEILQEVVKNLWIDWNSLVHKALAGVCSQESRHLRLEASDLCMP
jgi:hypothetical protein